ncbi:hypothetical protein N7533_000159 [Penicillium manginii]|uniref:uncharacterized protein n=1 Tax=Penicillium manginii TaxID=203109 RepID=UPI0025489783|nr:uncharacterized protein N7533_000159 [Penicillium manginii]KAJ5767576.1 hypothetical protein N7533_000159 [Penicillium manginii]
MTLSQAPPSKCILSKNTAAPDGMPLSSIKSEPAGTFNADILSELEKSLSRAPLNIAAWDARSDQAWTFADLAQQSVAVANRICSSSGVIALYFEPSPSYIVAILSAIQLGRPYLAIDPRIPRQQQELMLSETEASVLLHSTSYWPEQKAFNVETLAIEDIASTASQEPHFRPFNQPIMCILYTSGSTSRPKGVKIPYSAVFNRLSWQWRTQPFAADDIVALKTGIGFVDSIAELLAPLLRGIPMVTIPGSFLYDSTAMLQTLESFRVTRISVVPSFLRTILAPLKERPALYNLSLKVVVSSGEELLLDICEEFFSCLSHCQLHNYYGSTEVMGDVTALRLHTVEDARAASLEGRISIGNAIDNMELSLHHCDEEGVGELFCAGAGLSVGYLRSSGEQSTAIGPFATTKEFNLQHVQSHEDQMWFRTGDLVKMQNGQVFFCGRRDDMVKIAGNKVDVGHVGRVVREVGVFTLPPVIIHSSALSKLILFYRPERNINVEDLSAALRERLPNPAIPIFAPVKEFTFLPTSGKIDKKAMLARFEEEICRDKEPVYDWADMNHLDSSILRQLQDFVAILGREGIRSESLQTLLAANFFTVGGTSLNLMSCVVQLRRSGMDISTADLFAAKSLWQVFDSVVGHQTSLPPSYPAPDWTVKPLDQSIISDAWEVVASNMVNTPPVCFMWDDAKGRKDCHDEMIQITKALEPFTLRTPFITFGVFDSENLLIGVCINILSDSGPEGLLGDGIVNKFLQFLGEVEEPVINHLQQKGYTGLFLENVITAIDRKHLPEPAERVKCMYFIEDEVLKVARERGAGFVLTTNTSPVTQDISRFLGYKEESLINACIEWTDEKGEPYVPSVDGDFNVQVTYKLLEE